MCRDAWNVRCVAVCGCSPLSSWMALSLWGLLRLLVRVACVMGVAMREDQVVCCCLRVEKENISKVMKVCVCVCVLVGVVGEAKIGTKCTYTFVRPGIGAVSGVGSSGVMCSGISE
jgi:hypothetical protein